MLLLRLQCFESFIQCNDVSSRILCSTDSNLVFITLMEPRPQHCPCTVGLSRLMMTSLNVPINQGHMANVAVILVELSTPKLSFMGDDWVWEIR